MSKKQKPEDLITASLNFKFDKSKVVKAVKETLGKTAPSIDIRHKVVWDDTSGTKVDAQVCCIIIARDDLLIGLSCANIGGKILQITNYFNDLFLG